MKKRKPNIVQRAVAGMLGLDWLLQISAGDGAFKGANSNRLLADWSTQGFTADDELKGNLRALRVRARDLSRNNPYIRQFLTLVAGNVIGPNGFDHDANVVIKAPKVVKMLPGGKPYPNAPPEDAADAEDPSGDEAPQRAFAPKAKPAAGKPGAPPFPPKAKNPNDPNAPDDPNAPPEPPQDQPDVETNAILEEAFAEWARVCTVDRRLSFTAAQWLAIKTVAMDGECFIRMITGYPNDHGFALQFVDPDLIDETYNLARGESGGKEVRLGVEVDEWGGAVAYYVLDRPYSMGIAPPDKRTRVEAYNPLTGKGEMLHLYIPSRINQTRGYSWMASVMVSFKMLSGYEEAELVASRTAAAKMGFIQTKEGSLGELSTTDDSETNPVMEANPGSIERLIPGTEFQAWDPTHPTAQYADFVKGILRGAATGLCVSYNALCNDLEGVNYSSMRSGLLIERDVWSMMHSWWIEQFLTPVYERWLMNVMLKKVVSLPKDDPAEYRNVRWTARGWPWVDPTKDGQSAVLEIENGLNSRTAILAEKGIAYEDVLKDLKREEEMAKAAGVKVKQAPPALPPGFGKPGDPNAKPGDPNAPDDEVPPVKGKKPPPPQ